MGFGAWALFGGVWFEGEWLENWGECPTREKARTVLGLIVSGLDLDDLLWLEGDGVEGRGWNRRRCEEIARVDGFGFGVGIGKNAGT